MKQSISSWDGDKESEGIKSLMPEKSANPLRCFQLSPVTSGSRITVRDHVLSRCQNYHTGISKYKSIITAFV